MYQEKKITLKHTTMAKINNITVKDVYSEISTLNAAGYYRYERGMGSQMADTTFGSIISFLPKDSLAYKIVSTAKSFSSKQLWVIAYELIKSEAYVAELIAANRQYNLDMYGDEECEN